MIVEFDEGFVIGYHGFINCRIVEDVINGGMFWACEIIFKDSTEEVRVEVNRNWFGEWRNKMRLQYGDYYDVKWHEFHAAFVKYAVK
ncbi:hypothetical protein [Serratia bockelmannii]|uniref:hypothetical protein n=1 Tax=Serratia bockelmannii TaxID=2703793 RepID=UPI003F6C8755